LVLISTKPQSFDSEYET